MNSPVVYLVMGLAAGILSGILGLGGGIMLIPALVYMCGMTQHMAQGTTLAAMVPPIGLLAAWQYYKHGDVNIGVAALVCAGFFVGGYVGALFVPGIPDLALKRLFGIVMMLVALRMIFSR